MQTHGVLAYLLAVMVLGRAAIALFGHGMLRPGTPAVLIRSSGRVVRR